MSLRQMYLGISSWYVLFGVIEVVSENNMPHLHNFAQICPLVIQQVQELTDIMSATKYSPQALGAVLGVCLHHCHSTQPILDALFSLPAELLRTMPSIPVTYSIRTGKSTPNNRRLTVRYDSKGLPLCI